MAINDINEILNKKFSQPLEEFYKRRIIIWDDYDNEFINLINELQLNNAKILILSDNNKFYSKKLLLEDDPLSNYLVYNPIKFNNDNDNWLLDIFEYSEHYKADYISSLLEEINADDTAIIRNTVKDYRKFFENSKRKQKFIELTSKVEDTKNIHLTILSVLTNSKTKQISEILLSLFKEGWDEDNKLLNNIKSFGNINKFYEIMFKIIGYEGTSLEELLYTICITSLGQTINYGNIKSFYPKYFKNEYVSNCYNIVQEWFMEDNDFSSKLLLDVGREININKMLEKLKINEMYSCDIFPHINGWLLTNLFNEIKNNVIKTKETFNLINKRKTMRFYKEYQNYYEGIYNICMLYDLYIENQDIFHMTNSKELWDVYENRLYKFDTYYRKFHYHFNKSLKTNTNLHIDDLFKDCADYIENIYKNWYLNNLNSCWNKLCNDDFIKYGKIKDINHQVDFYNRFVKNSLDEKTTFVIISDALRYEVGMELYNVLIKNENCNVKIKSMQSVFPSITNFGMASLLPGKKYLNNDGDIFVNEIKSDSLKNRGLILNKSGVNSLTISYDEFIRMKKSEKIDLIKGIKLVYMYHDEIDKSGHTFEEQVFESCDDSIENLKNLVSVITSIKPNSKILITADHGFLYNYKPLDEFDKISKNNVGDILEYGRRYIIGTNNSLSDYLLNIKLLINTENETFRGFAPLDTVRIKMPGNGENYVHGGISIEELMIPVISYENVKVNSKEYINNQEKYNKKKAIIKLSSDTRRISNSSFPLNFYQTEKVCNNTLEAIYEIYMQDNNGNLISDVKTIIANKVDDDASLRTFKILLTLKNQQFSNNDPYYLVIVDKESGDLIDRIEFNINILFNSDFDF